MNPSRPWKLYVVSLFLDPAQEVSLLAQIRRQGLGETLRAEVITDQTGASAPTWQLASGGLQLILLPANDFHGPLDWEVGLTPEGPWDEALGALEAAGAVAEAGCLDGDVAQGYAVLGSPGGHCPFFAMAGGPASVIEPGDRLEAVLPADELAFYREKVAGVLDAGLREALAFTGDPDLDRPRFRSLRVRGLELGVPHGPGEGDHVADVPHAGDVLHQPLEPEAET